MRAFAFALTGFVLLVPAAAHAAPVAMLDSFIETTNPQYQHSIGPVHWVNPMQSGSFDVRINATDAMDGIQRVDFPSFGGSGWSPGTSDMSGPSPYASPYTWTAGATQPGIVSAVAWSNTAASVTAPFEVRTDSFPPIGSSVTTPNVVTNAASINVTFTAPSDSGSGVGSTQMQRRSASFGGGSCATFGPWVNVGAANPASPFTDSALVDGTCYEYRHVALDNVGNSLIFVGAGTVKVDRTNPSGTISAAPIGPVSGPVTLSGTAADSSSGVSHVDVQYTGPESGNVCLAPPTPQAWECDWDTSTLAPGVYTISLTVTDLANNSSAVTRVLMVDAPPVLLDTNAGVAIAEGGAGTTFDVVLASAPSSDVTVTVDPDGQVVTDASTLTFTPANWNVPQTVSVDAVDDAIDEAGAHDGAVAFTTTSADPTFNGVSVGPITFDIADNDVASVLVSAGPPPVIAVNEAGATSGTFTVALSSQPTSPVSISLDDVAGQVAAAPASLAFTSANWSTPQVVTVTAIDDAVDEGAHTDAVTFVVSSADTRYDGLSLPDLSVTVADDDAAPSGSATAAFASTTELTGSPYQHASGSTVWFNPAQAGSFTLNATASALPGLSSVTFPALGSGWTPGTSTVDTLAPYGATYAWTAGASAPGPRTIVATSSGGITGSGAFTVAADATPPTGPTITAQSTVTRDTSAPVSGTAGTDMQSGIGSWRYQRRAAMLAADTCGPYGAWADLNGMNPAGPISDASLPDSSCLQYQLVVADNVGNATTVSQAGELRVDRTAPVATIDAIVSPLHGTVTIAGSAADATTRVRSVAVIVEDRYSICASAPLANGRWSCDWTIGPREVGAANIKVTVTDAAGQRTSVTQAVTIVAPPSPLGPREEDIDRTPPVVGLARMPLVSWELGVKVKASAYDDRPGLVEIRVEQQAAGVASLRFTPWAPSFEESEIVPLEDRGETTCFRGIAIDEAGNKATSDPRCTTVPLDDMDLTATGDWAEVSSGGAWLGSARRSTKPGSALSTKVFDPTPTIVVTRCAKCGSIKVFHGKRLVGVYSLKAKKTLARQLVQLPVLKNPTSATLKIVAVNGKPVFVDALVATR